MPTRGGRLGAGIPGGPERPGGMAGNPGGTDGVDEITESVDCGRIGGTGAASCEVEPASESSVAEGAGEGEGCGATETSFFAFGVLLSVAGAEGTRVDEGVDGREDGVCCEEVLTCVDLRSLLEVVAEDETVVVAFRLCRVPPAPRRVGREDARLAGTEAGTGTAVGPLPQAAAFGSPVRM